MPLRHHPLLPFAAALAGVGFLSLMDAFMKEAALMIGAYELMHCPEIPYRVVINEGVELAKSFGGTDGHKYVNAVLNGLAPELRSAEVEADRQSGRAK